MTTSSDEERKERRRAVVRESQRRRRTRAMQAGLCMICGIRVPSVGLKSCAHCRAIIVEAQKRRQNEEGTKDDHT